MSYLHPDATGTLRHLQGWHPSPPDPRDYMLAAHRPDLADGPVAASSDLRGLYLPIEDQGQLGSCTAFGSGGIFEAVSRKTNAPIFQSSKLAQYYWTRQLGGFPLNQDTGAYVRDAMKSLAQMGMAPTQDWPYITQNFAVAPPAIAVSDASTHQATKYVSVPVDANQVKAVLTGGYPVVVGFSVWQGFMSTGSDGMVPRGAGAIIGGHCVSVCGHNDTTGRFTLRNSWSTNWGAQGYCYMLYDDLIRYGADFWMLSEVEGPTPPPPPPPPPPTTKTWTVTGPDGVVHHLTEV